VGNDHLQLLFNSTSGRLTSVQATDGTWSLPLQHSLMWYRSSDGHEREQWGLGSGAYIFRPASSSPVSVPRLGLAMGSVDWAWCMPASFVVVQSGFHHTHFGGIIIHDSRAWSDGSCKGRASGGGRVHFSS
jgi:hypothetical protein